MEQFRLSREEALTLSTDQITERRVKFEIAQRKHQKEAIELVLICAKDIVDAWPTLTFRTLVSMTKRIDTLAQALKEIK